MLARFLKTFSRDTFVGPLFRSQNDGIAKLLADCSRLRRFCTGPEGDSRKYGRKSHLTYNRLPL